MVEFTTLTFVLSFSTQIKTSLSPQAIDGQEARSLPFGHLPPLELLKISQGSRIQKQKPASSSQIQPSNDTESEGLLTVPP